MGERAWEIEPRLTKAFDRTARWNAILLFDEADAFMAKRSNDSFERNAMVSCTYLLLTQSSKPQTPCLAANEFANLIFQPL
jgi:SpoVK/Ycf46/Vps4 family AAA+-type ATPase